MKLLYLLLTLVALAFAAQSSADVSKLDLLKPTLRHSGDLLANLSHLLELLIWTRALMPISPSLETAVWHFLMAIIFFTIFLIRDARNATMAHLTPSQTQVYRETERSIVLKSLALAPPWPW